MERFYLYKLEEAIKKNIKIGEENYGKMDHQMGSRNNL